MPKPTVQIIFTIGDLHMEGEKKRSNEIMGQAASILDHLDIAIYVSDMATHKIVFTNRALQQMYGDTSLIDRICWETLWARDRRCEFCPIPYLLMHPGESYHWGLAEGGSQFQLCDSIIPWIDGKLMHLQYMVEISYDQDMIDPVKNADGYD